MPPRRGGSNARGFFTGELDRESLARLTAASSAAVNGAALRRAYAQRMRDATRPAVQRAKASIRGADLGGSYARSLAGAEKQAKRRARVQVPRLRNEIAKAVRAVVRTSVPMVRIEVEQTPQVRSFGNAGKRTQEPKWRHPVFGNRETWVNQRGKKDWFRNAVLADRDGYADAARSALRDFADDLGDRID
jgi:hypothetical protein